MEKAEGILKSAFTHEHTPSYSEVWNKNWILQSKAPDDPGEQDDQGPTLCRQVAWWFVTKQSPSVWCDFHFQELKQLLPCIQITAHLLWSQLWTSFFINGTATHYLSWVERHKVGVQANKCRARFVVCNFVFKGSYTWGIVMNQGNLMMNVSTWWFHRLVRNP